jgi:hypothetical protein
LGDNIRIAFILAGFFAFLYAPALLAAIIPGYFMFDQWEDSRAGFEPHSAPKTDPRTHDEADPLWDRDCDV